MFLEILVLSVLFRSDIFKLGICLFFLPYFPGPTFNSRPAVKKYFRNLCGRHVIRKAIWRISKLEIWNLKSAVSVLCGCLSFACFEKKWGKVSWIFQNSSIRHITNTLSYDMPTTQMAKKGMDGWLTSIHQNTNLVFSNFCNWKRKQTFNWSNIEKKTCFGPRKSFSFFFNCSNLEKFVENKICYHVFWCHGQDICNS